MPLPKNFLEELPDKTDGQLYFMLGILFVYFVCKRFLVKQAIRHVQTDVQPNPKESHDTECVSALNSMKITANNPWALEEQARLVRKYLAQHQERLEELRGVRWLKARLKLEFEAWRYAERELRKRRGY